MGWPQAKCVYNIYIVCTLPNHSRLVNGSIVGTYVVPSLIISSRTLWGWTGKSVQNLLYVIFCQIIPSKTLSLGWTGMGVQCLHRLYPPWSFPVGPSGVDWILEREHSVYVHMLYQIIPLGPCPGGELECFGIVVLRPSPCPCPVCQWLLYLLDRFTRSLLKPFFTLWLAGADRIITQMGCSEFPYSARQLGMYFQYTLTPQVCVGSSASAFGRYHVLFAFFNMVCCQTLSWYHF